MLHVLRLSFMKNIWKENLLALVVGRESPQSIQLWFPTADTQQDANCLVPEKYMIYFNVSILPLTL